VPGIQITGRGDSNQRPSPICDSTATEPNGSGIKRLRCNESDRSAESAHALPTSLPEDLAEVVEHWSSLTPETRAEVLGLIRSELRGREKRD
jgi:hypothetical protein